MKAALIVLFAVAAMASSQDVDWVNGDDSGSQVHFVDSPNGGFQKPSIEPAYAPSGIQVASIEPAYAPDGTQEASIEPALVNPDSAYPYRPSQHPFARSN